MACCKGRHFYFQREFVEGRQCVPVDKWAWSEILYHAAKIKSAVLRGSTYSVLDLSSFSASKLACIFKNHLFNFYIIFIYQQLTGKHGKSNLPTKIGLRAMLRCTRSRWLPRMARILAENCSELISICLSIESISRWSENALQMAIGCMLAPHAGSRTPKFGSAHLNRMSNVVT